MPGNWDDEEASDASSSPEETTKVVVAGRRKFDDEEDEDEVRFQLPNIAQPSPAQPGSVLDSWDAAEDSEVEREKAKKAEEAKAKAEAEAKASKKSKAQRMQEKIAERQRQKEEGDSDYEEETEAEKRARLAQAQKEADLKHAEDLFGAVGGVPASRKATIKGSVVPDPKNPDNLIDLSAMPLFDPKTKAQFEQLREVIGPIISGNYKKAHYSLFLVEFAKQLAKDMPSDQIKKVASALTTLSNEKMKEEKAQEKGGKKSKAAKTKTTLAISRPSVTDTTAYGEETFGDDDFM
ncbi:Eukaryotic translation initiation factor 3 subunit J [Cytospora mali]|uniref:Eukaryotic translation initiation factor 3 subunit J n=1 Tax=Cytospora mali TaxID=578113 RepID=A0A194VXD8_CYTMA|nr:Eukaryotic translation initiation factor 3 subunit J [Valsa mali]